MSARDFYDVLGVSKSASDDQIKRAYRRLAKEYHPDRNPDDKSAEAKFKEVQAAHDVLKDRSKRAQYDRFGPAAVGNWQTTTDGQQVYTWSGDGPEIRMDDLEDLFSAFGGFGDSAGGRSGANPFADLFSRTARGARRHQPAPSVQRGQNVERGVNLSFEQAVLGTGVEVDVVGGGGNHQTLEVKIPAGVEDGKRMRIKGKGRPGPGGGPPGDLYLKVSVRPHRYLRREGNDLYIDVPLTIAEASLGAKVDIPTLEGTVTLTIPPGTGSGSRLRMAGRGIKRAGKKAGDLYAVIKIAAVKDPDEGQARLLRELAGTLPGDPRAEQGW